MINLEKGQRIEVDLTKVNIGLGWDPSSDEDNPYDLDATAFMLNKQKKLPKDEFFVFYNNLVSPDGAVESMGDDLTGGNSDGGDDETIKVELDKVSQEVEEIIFCASIYKHKERRQNFGQVHNSYIRIYNSETDEEIARYDLDEDFSVETAVEFGRLYRRNGTWKFEAMGQGSKTGLEGLVAKYQ